MFLNCHTYYSLRYGSIAIEELLELARSFNISTLSLTDINSTSACLEFLRTASKYGVKPVVGVDFRNGANQEFVLIAKNNTGFENINAYLSEFLHQDTYQIPQRSKLMQDVYVVYPFQKNIDFELLPNEFIGISYQELAKLPFSKWKNKLDKLVVLHTVSFQNKKGFNTHRLLRAIDNNELLSRLHESEQGELWHQFVSEETIEKYFEHYPDIISNTKDLMSSCNVVFDFSGEVPNNQKSYTANEALDYKLLEKLSYRGLEYRYPKADEKVYVRIKKELEIIKEKGFVSYFLINWKILKYARSKGYFYVGRGSGANSIIAYLLRITDVDPIELDLYFERFINLYRKNPPDFDIDFSWQDRDDITNFIFKRFPNTALITVYNTFKYRAAIRELGKVFGLPKSEIDVLSSGSYNYQTLDKLSQLVVIYSKFIQGFPNYLGIHAGGILISEKPIHHYCGTFLPPKGFATTQIDMVIAEDIGLYKFDILSQRGLGKIKDAVGIVAKNHADLPPIDIHNIAKFKEDLRIKYLLKNAKAIGCFYVESPAMRMLLKKLQVDNYLGLVAASSVIRPGVAQSGMMREYILRFRYPERRKDAHPVLLDIMPETYGVMVYQEDVIKVAHYFGGLTLGEADMLRRGMSGKFRSRDEFLKVKEQFFSNCRNTGKDLNFTQEVWRQIESFAGYAFAKGHSASYAVESYQSLYLKAYFPLEYMVATINNSGGFYSVELYIHEARLHGGNILAPCVNHSEYIAVIKGKDIYLGFMFLQSFETKTAIKIINERVNNGRFLSLDDFIERVPISIEQITILIKIDAFRDFGKHKRELLWEAHMKINKVTFDEFNISLFQVERAAYEIPKLTSTQLENAFDEIELLGFPLSNPFNLLVDKNLSTFRMKNLVNYIGKIIVIEGYLVTVKKTKTSKGKQMFFGTFLDVDGDFIDSVHFPPVAQKYPFRGKGIYRITGKVMEEFDCITVETTMMERLAIVEDPRYADSRKAQRPKPKKRVS
ncbi:DNA polymerase III subunit alpha [Tenacibaculum sp. 190524A05c]|uniref:DNA-directed DNA polymerase n=1 Tax=Tenacibaculum platacis TaxID=3137852 RepID=A0ABM9P5E1_9FLAO